MAEFEARLAAAQDQVSRTLARLLDQMPAPGQEETPARLNLAMRYATLSGGKRLRPFLLIEAARLFGKEGEGVGRAAAALECVHCYSLVHDDLPAMDDDDLRRGKPTVHRAFDDATAILAGDALLTLAFGIIADPATDPDAGVRVTLIAELAQAAGDAGMAGGQIIDLTTARALSKPAAPASVGAAAAPAPLPAMAAAGVTEAVVNRLMTMKTGALFRFAAEAGAVIGRAHESERQALVRYGRALGLAFQVADDILDATGSQARAGKATAKDAGLGKATLVALLGVEAARARLAELIEQALAALAPLPRATLLADLARHVGGQT